MARAGPPSEKPAMDSDWAGSRNRCTDNAAGGKEFPEQRGVCGWEGHSRGAGGTWCTLEQKGLSVFC